MVKSIDQAPQYQDNSPEEPSAGNVPVEQSPAHEPLRYVNTDLEQALQSRALKGMSEDGSLNIPDHVPRSLVENPDAGGAREVVPSADKKPSWIKRGIAATVAVGAVGAAAYGIGYLKTKGEVDALNDARGGDVTTSAPATPGQETARDYSNVDPNTLTVEQFYDDTIYPQEYRIKWANEIIKEREQQAHAELSSILVEHGYPALGPLVEPDTNNTGDEIMVQHDVVNYIASTTPARDEGLKLLAASSSIPVGSKMLSTFGNEPIVTFHGVPQSDATNAELESPVFTHATAGDYTPNGVPSKVVISINGITSEASQTIERFVGGRYITVSSIGTTNPNWIVNPNLITDK